MGVPRVAKPPGVRRAAAQVPIGWVTQQHPDALARRAGGIDCPHGVKELAINGRGERVPRPAGMLPDARQGAAVDRLSAAKASARSWYRAWPNSTTMSPATAGKAGCPISPETKLACSASQCASPSATSGALANAANTPATASTGHGSIGPDVTGANSSVISFPAHRARHPAESIGRRWFLRG